MVPYICKFSSMILLKDITETCKCLEKVVIAKLVDNVITTITSNKAQRPWIKLIEADGQNTN